MTTRLRSDAALVFAFLRSGVSRAALVTFATALVAGLLLVVVTVLLFAEDPRQSESLGNLVADPGVRAGYVFGLLLICIAPLTLLRQVVRLGTAAREQRLASLRMAGATPGDVRRWGALEVATPAFLGGLLGYPVFLALRLVFGGHPSGSSAMVRPGSDSFAQELRLIPMSVQPTWWHVLAVAVLVGAMGAVAGATTTRGLTISPVGVSRRAPRSAPRPWGVVLMLLAVAAFVLSFVGGAPDVPGTLFGIVVVSLLVLGLLALTPWIAYRVGRAVAARASQPHVLLAARRLATDPRPAGRAAAAIGAIGMVAGAGGALASDLPSTAGGQGFGAVDPMYTVPVALVAGVLVAAMLLVVLSLTVHGVESLVDRRRAIASLAALGTAQGELLRVQRWEVGLVAVPVTALGVLIGSVPYVVVADWFGPYVWIPVLVDLTTVALAWLAVLTSARLTRRWLMRTASPANLRTA
jgi:hypothetical protein